MSRRILSIFLVVIFLVPVAAFFLLTNHLSHPEMQLDHVQSQAMNGEKSLPFYEVMSPLPSGNDIWILPSLEYKKGPPDRYIEKMSLLVSKVGKREKEKVIYYGRRTDSDFWLNLGMNLMGSNIQEANFLANAIYFSVHGEMPIVPFYKKPILQIAMLKAAAPYLDGVDKTLIQDQADIPAFFFLHKSSENSQMRASVIFFRRNSQYRIDYLAEQNFEILHPEDYFTKSFLVGKRQDALEYVARNLSEVQFAATSIKSISLKDTSWPLSLLAATLSVDPSSIDAYFHFAGLSGLLFKSKELQTNDSEIIDILRNNVLATGFYAQDVSPQSLKASEIARLARSLTKNLD